MTKLQFRILYREFFFCLVDREVLSSGAQGDASKLFGRIASILVLLSIPFTIPVIAIGDSRLPHEGVLVAAWPAEHALIATTMLIVGLFAVLSWDSAYPERRDIFVLTPLPVRASTIFLAKIASLTVALSVAAVIFNAASGLLLPATFAVRGASILDVLFSIDLYRQFAAYWITMFSAGTFVLGCILVRQGMAGQLPRRLALRISPLLQLATFCVLLSSYLLQPSIASPEALTAPHNQHLLPWLPSYWFLGFFQQLNGSIDVFNGSVRPALAPLATRAWTGLGFAVVTAGAMFFLSYSRTLRRIVEQPDIVPSSHRLNWLPRFGITINTAVTQFSIRSILRSRQHRMLLSFYLGIGFGVVILYLKTPVAHQLLALVPKYPRSQVSLPLLASSFVMMFAWIIGIRVVFSIPLELKANWIFRITQIRTPADYFLASRRAAYVVALFPVWAFSTMFFLFLWRWRQALGHEAVLVLLGITIIELWLHGFHKIPLTCSYLPGKTNLHITFLLCVMLGLNAIYWSADFELRALSDMPKYLRMIAALGAVASFAWWKRARATSGAVELQFEEEPPLVITTLGI